MKNGNEEQNPCINFYTPNLVIYQKSYPDKIVDVFCSGVAEAVGDEDIAKP